MGSEDCILAWPNPFATTSPHAGTEPTQSGLGHTQSCSDAKVTKSLRERGNCSCCCEAQSHTFHSYGHSSASTTF